MKSTSKILMGLALFGMVFLTSCSDDDSAPPTPNASDISVTIDENPDASFVIGTITTNLSGTVSFSISAQSVGGAFSVDATSGEVTVNDASAFDFETNTTLTASVTATNGSEAAIGDVSVTLNDVDDIASFLSTSEAAYTAVAAGDWVIITAAEYNALASNINLTTKTGMSDTNYDMGPANGTFSNITVTNVEEPTMPIGSYIYAVKFNLINAITDDIKMKQSSTSVSAGYEDIGMAIVGGAAGDNYAVLKGSNSATTNAAYLAVFDSSGELGFRSITGITIQYDNGDANDLTLIQGGSAVFFQGLSTTQKQWD